VSIITDVISQQVEPGGVARANERPGIQTGEDIKVTRFVETTDDDNPIQTLVPVRGTAPTEPGTYSVGDVFPSAPDAVSGLSFTVQSGANYSYDTAGDELAAGTEGTVTDPIADAASRATNGATNDGQGLVDSSSGSITDVAGLSTAAVVAVAAVVALAVFGGS